MDAFALARLAAQTARKDQTFALSGLDAVKAAFAERGFAVATAARQSAGLNGVEAKLNREWKLALVDETADAPRQAELLAHELGHLDLHSEFGPCEPGLLGSTTRALSRVESYGPRERRELQANVFAREFLLPCRLARDLFLNQRLASPDIAQRLGLSVPLARRQLLDVLLEPTTAPLVRPVVAPPAAEPDESQEAAARAVDAALLVDAGPGSGKTRTLVARVEHLLVEGVPPAAIAALTFSNKAAAELAERIIRSRPDAAAELWAGTFHAYGLDLIRRHYDRLDLPPDPRLIDQAEAIELLEDHLPLLGLKHFHDLREPGLQLKSILRAISRAKDELVRPPAFREMAEAQLGRASTEKEQKVAEKAVEAARVYEVYADVLQSTGRVDYGDLVMRPALLLAEHDDIRAAVSARAAHVLVDEYQDVNRASASLVRELRRQGSHVWVVGDARQSIYRFRGASSVNMRAFEADFGGRRTPLKYNYRSAEALVSLSRTFSDGMSIGQPYAARAYHQTLPGDAARFVAHDDLSETELVAREVRKLVDQGVPLGDQAILAPRNARLDEIAKGFAARNVPVLHLGNFFEREEVRDALALLSLAAEPHGGALARVAASPEAPAAAADVAALVAAARAENRTVRELLARADGIEGVSQQGATSFHALAAALAGIEPHTPAYAAISIWLLDRSDVLRRLAQESGVAADLKRAALARLLGFLDDADIDGRPLTVRRALKRVRTVLLLEDDRDLKEPDLGTDIDAVRLMTIHGAKGLEFAAIHIVGLHEGGLPATRRPDECPPPVDLLDKRDPGDVHIEEQECLFFVAISRAARHLRMYRTEIANVRARKPSNFLARLGPVPETRLTSFAAPAATVSHPTPATIEHLTLQDVREYDQCPLKIAYRRTLAIRARRHEGPYQKTMGVLYEVVEHMPELVASGAGEDGVFSHFAEVWSQRGPHDHSLSADYRRLAEGRINALTRLVLHHEAHPEALSLPLDKGVLLAGRPLIRANGSTVRFFEAGRSTQDAAKRLTAGLTLAAPRRTFGPAVQVEIAHLMNEDVVAITRKPDQVGQDLSAANHVIEAVRTGNLPAKPETRVCIRCPHFFACPKTGLPPG